MASGNLKYWYLHEHRLFRNLSFSEIDALCILKKFKRSKKNEFVDLPFSDKERIYFIKKGIIKLISVDDNGEEQLIDILQKGDIFGDLNLERQSSDRELLKVVSDEAIICTFYREKLEEVMVKKPEFALNYIKFVGFNFKKLENNYKNILFKDAKTRLLLLIKRLIEKEQPLGNAYNIPKYLTQKDLAQLICTTRQTIITLIKDLESDGILEMSHKEIVIKDVDAINKFLENVK
ncbi:MAG: Crp/Fnr family transcriptional regulator [Hydrotalea sp.]|nr:Crp/Fnr family transcriptional regulator [Hydrotalea sp.]